MKMKSFLGVLFVLLILILSTASCSSNEKISRRLLGEDLARIEKSFAKKIERGKPSYLVNLAEVQFYRGKFLPSYKNYALADSLGFSLDQLNFRNYVHSAKITGQMVPKYVEKGFFSRELEFDIETTTFCGNSRNEDIVPYIYDEYLFVTSSRRATGSKYATTGKPFLNVVSFGEGCHTIPLPNFLPEGLNARFHNGPIAISADGNLIVINRNYPKANSDGFHHLYLDYYVKIGNQWSKPIVFPYCKPSFSIQHPFFNDADQTLYFSSDVPGGFGGFDLYKSKWNGAQWGQPENLGPEINTIYDEVFPVFSTEGDLIYSTNHLETNGGLDLVLFKDNQRYLFPYPLNGPFDDFGITFSRHNSGFFGSNRDRGLFEENIYSFSFVDRTKYDYVVQVVDSKTGENIEMVEIIFTHDRNNLSGQVFTNSDGRALLFNSILEANEPVNLELNKPGYEGSEQTVKEFLVTHEKNQLLAKVSMDPEIALISVAEAPIHISSGNIVVYFENDSPRQSDAISDYRRAYDDFLLAKLSYYRETLSSKQEMDAFFRDVELGMKSLEDFAQYLYENISGNKVDIFLEGFASPLSTYMYNKRLSERRNESIKRYFELWNGGKLKPFFDDGSLRITGVFHGDTKASQGVSSSITELGKSVYGVNASRERKVTIHYTWTGSSIDIKLPIIVAPEPETVKPEEDFFQGFYVIVGGFSRKDAAESFASSLRQKGFDNAGVMETPELNIFRVYANRYHQQALAEYNLQKYQRGIVPDAWILRVGF